MQLQVAKEILIYTNTIIQSNQMKYGQVFIQRNSCTEVNIPNKTEAFKAK